MKMSTPPCRLITQRTCSLITLSAAATCSPRIELAACGCCFEKKCQPCSRTCGSPRFQWPVMCKLRANRRLTGRSSECSLPFLAQWPVFTVVTKLFVKFPFQQYIHSSHARYRAGFTYFLLSASYAHIQVAYIVQEPTQIRLFFDVRSLVHCEICKGFEQGFEL